MRPFSWRNFGFVAPAFVCLMIALPLSFAATSSTPQQPTDSRQAVANLLVHDALLAEVDGDANRRADDLKQSLAMNSALPQVHWQLGEVRRGDRWLSTSAVEQETASSEKLSEYRKLRDQAGNTAEEQIKLARWCDKNGLKDQEQAHAMVALQLEPGMKEAIRRLNLVKFRGQLIPKKQLDEIKEKVRKSAQDSRAWNERLVKLVRQYSIDPASRNSILSQIRAINDLEAIPAIESVLASSDPEIALAAVDSLTAMPDLKATQSLVRFAVFADSENARDAATKALKKRSPYAYVPVLLFGMQSTISGDSQILGVDGITILNQLVMVQEQPDQIVVKVANGRFTPVATRTQADIIPAPMEQAIASDTSNFRSSLQVMNEKNSELNKRISTVLANVSDQKLDSEPKSWWNWWYDQNDYYQPPEKPVRTQRYGYNVPVSMRCSCFVAGTPVWTASGPMPIERIRAGELVLSQNSETGELAYKPVLATTVRPKAQTLQTRIGTTTVKSTRGHPFWVTGIGWQMAKELKTGQRLHTAKGSVSIDEISESEPAECYNLVVAEFNSYFVGDCKLLVHDNTLRGPTSAVVPGLVAP